MIKEKGIDVIEYVTGVIVWLCISSGIAISCKDLIIQNKWISKDDIRRAMGDGKGKAIFKFIAINMIPIFRTFACVAVVLMALVDKEDISW